MTQRITSARLQTEQTPQTERRITAAKAQIELIPNSGAGGTGELPPETQAQQSTSQSGRPSQARQETAASTSPSSATQPSAAGSAGTRSTQSGQAGTSPAGTTASGAGTGQSATKAAPPAGASRGTTTESNVSAAARFAGAPGTLSTTTTGAAGTSPPPSTTPDQQGASGTLGGASAGTLASTLSPAQGSVPPGMAQAGTPGRPSFGFARGPSGVGTPTAGALGVGYGGRGKMPKLKVNFFDRSFSPIQAGSINVSVSKFSRNAIGGPSTCTITAVADEQVIFRLFSWLRYGVEITDGNGRKPWYGYIHQVEITAGGFRHRMTLDGMSNDIQVKYNALAAGSTGSGTATSTAYASDAKSVAVYGTRQLIVNASDVHDATSAENRRAVLLDEFGWPQKTLDDVGGNQTVTALIVCRGWWDTLSWRMYSNAGTSDVATTTQISDIIDEAEFITGATITDASGITTNEYRDGNGRASQEVADLLKSGVSGGRRLLATVDEYRGARIYQEPAEVSTNFYRMNRSRRLVDPYGRPVPPHMAPAGVWVQVTGVLPPGVEQTLQGAPNLFFAESVEYDVASDFARFRTRGQPSPNDFVRIKQG